MRYILPALAFATIAVAGPKYEMRNYQFNGDLTVKGCIHADGCLLTDCGIGAKNGATVSVVEQGNCAIHKTVLTLASTPMTLTTNGSECYGSVKLYDFPAGVIVSQGGIEDLTLTAAGIAADATLFFHVGDDQSDGDGGPDPTTEQEETWLLSDSTTLSASAGTYKHPDSIYSYAGNTCIDSGTCGFRDGATSSGNGAADFWLNLSANPAVDPGANGGTVTISGTVTITWMNLGDY